MVPPPGVQPLTASTQANRPSGLPSFEPPPDETEDLPNINFNAPVIRLGSAAPPMKSSTPLPGDRRDSHAPSSQQIRKHYNRIDELDNGDNLDYGTESTVKRKRGVARLGPWSQKSEKSLDSYRFENKGPGLLPNWDITEDNRFDSQHPTRNAGHVSIPAHMGKTATEGLPSERDTGRLQALSNSKTQHNTVDFQNLGIETPSQASLGGLTPSQWLGRLVHATPLRLTPLTT
ncbi:hypothetical protein V8F33_011196 [Rhypophila sp. PSN 637]